MRIEIKSRWDGVVVFSGDFESIRQCVEAAANSGADLSGADLYRANLSGADLSRANFSRANLSRADLSGADLSRANFSRANLSRADLSGADLYRANLSRANLSRADLSGADLSITRADFLAEVLKLPNELEFLRQALVDGKVNGSTYNDGECGCLAGTLAIAKGIKGYSGEEIKNGLTFHADGSSPRERFFLAIKKGDTPETNSASSIALQWTDEAIAIRDNILNSKK